MPCLYRDFRIDVLFASLPACLPCLATRTNITFTSASSSRQPRKTRNIVLGLRYTRIHYGNDSLINIFRSSVDWTSSLTLARSPTLRDTLKLNAWPSYRRDVWLLILWPAGRRRTRLMMERVRWFPEAIVIKCMNKRRQCIWLHPVQCVRVQLVLVLLAAVLDWMDGGEAKEGDVWWTYCNASKKAVGRLLCRYIYRCCRMDDGPFYGGNERASPPQWSFMNVFSAWLGLLADALSLCLSHCGWVLLCCTLAMSQSGRAAW